MESSWRRRILPVFLVAVGLTATAALPSPAASPPNFDVKAKGAVDFGCANAADPFPVCLNPPAFAITGTAPASGPHVGGKATFSTREIATPIPPDFTQNSIEGNAMVTATNGDQIFIHYFGTSPAPNPDPATGIGQLNDNLTFEITGGTGRFEDARGSGKLVATGDVFFDARPTVVDSELSGTIKMHAH
jgi:hypothetical protein